MKRFSTACVEGAARFVMMVFFCTIIMALMSYTTEISPENYTLFGWRFPALLGFMRFVQVLIQYKEPEKE